MVGGGGEGQPNNQSRYSSVGRAPAQSAGGRESWASKTWQEELLKLVLPTCLSQGLRDNVRNTYYWGEMHNTHTHTSYRRRYDFVNR